MAEEVKPDYHRVAELLSVEEEACEFWFRAPYDAVRRHHSHDNDSCPRKVPTYPMRIPCACCQGPDGQDCYCEMDNETSCCHGLGWVPSQDGMKLMEDLYRNEIASILLVHVTRPSKKIKAKYVCYLEGDDDWHTRPRWIGRADTPAAALVEAAIQFLEATLAT